MKEYTDTTRIQYLQDLLTNCPHAEISYNDDPDEEDERGMKPIGWRIYVEGCETIDRVAPTLREVIDLEIADLESRGRSSAGAECSALTDPFMITEEISKLTPEEKCREIALACGWKRTKRESGIMEYPTSNEQWRKYGYPPSYDTDLNAALELCDMLDEQGWRCHIDNGLDKTWECTFTHSVWTMDEGTGDRPVSHYAPADTLAAAISHAFLLVQGAATRKQNT